MTKKVIYQNKTQRFLLLRSTLLTTAFALGAGLACEEKTSSESGCQSDSDCKGDRICEFGECVDPQMQMPDSTTKMTDDTTTDGEMGTGEEPLCGNGMLDENERCDDGNDLAYDGCDADCQPTPLGVISTGDSHTCALLGAGEVRCWGWGAGGALGYGNEESMGDNEKPNSAGPVSLGGKAFQLAAGSARTCALIDNGDVRCWGYNAFGVLGYGNEDDIGDDELPSSIEQVSLGGKATQIATGNDHTCAILGSGDVRCWGTNFSGKLGYGHENNIGDDELPSSVSPISLGGKAMQITAGYDHTCALLEAGIIRCWGNNWASQLGYSDIANQIGDDELPSSADPVNLGGKAIQVTAGQFHTCALLEGGDVRCWGINWFGKLGYGYEDSKIKIGDDELPSSVGPVSLGGKATQISSYHNHTCALLENGDVRCWGENTSGQLGYGHTNDIGDDELPSSVSPVNLGGKAIQISVGYDHSCALLEGGDLLCWGQGQYGKLGYGNEENIGDEPGEMPPPPVPFK